MCFNSGVNGNYQNFTLKNLFYRERMTKGITVILLNQNLLQSIYAYMLFKLKNIGWKQSSLKCK